MLEDYDIVAIWEENLPYKYAKNGVNWEIKYKKSARKSTSDEFDVCRLKPANFPVRQANFLPLP